MSYPILLITITVALARHVLGQDFLVDSQQEVMGSVVCPCDFMATGNDSLWDCDKRNLNEVPRQCWTNGFSSVTQVILSNNFITEIHAEDFVGLGSLKELILNNNNITSVAAGAFKPLAGLNTLDLYHNNIAQLPDDVFEGLVNLETLWVYHNLLQTIPDISFLTNAKAISLSNNNIDTFPKYLLDAPSFPLNLFLHNNLATEISASAILNLPDYSTLYIDAITVWAADAQEAEALRAKSWFGTELDGLIQIAAQADCPSHFHDVLGVCVLVEPFFSGDWGTMSYFCREMGAEMLKVADANFFQQLLHLLRSEGLDHHDYWLGGNDTAEEGSWKWADGTPIERGSPFWATQPQGPESFLIEPLGGTSENCLYLDKSRFLYFDDGVCTEAKNVICQQH
ncbi:insulin-like growth factor-binding protein complex acid labile subunit [Penaeus chinensis]|uniref:insulin-like growth factor-binding protein complex acid labile subunit n=1 Tax=Penaeus chinensis TaxID=139456 RepID=UPI001FB83694|nr:insulin-like growth factor-binding protein complex acid labile subunit [Penaeus chinensis]